MEALKVSADARPRNTAGRSFVAGASSVSGIGRGQFEEERRAAALVVRIADHAAVRVDDAVAHRQAEAGALADGLRREERLEQLALVARLTPGPLSRTSRRTLLPRPTA